MNLRDPALYARHESEDYWRLYYQFGREMKPPKTPHPLLGWVGDFDRQTFRHHQDGELGVRRPVLLYGDSFAQCVAETKSTCFEKILNVDEEFSRDHYLLNYGVGGYGVGQIYLLLRETIDLYENPFVIFSLFLGDLHRTPLSVRIGPKPYFTLEDGELHLRGTPVARDPAQFFAEHPAHVGLLTFHLARMAFVRSRFNVFFDRSHAGHGPEDPSSIESKKNLNEAVLLKAVELLRERRREFLFLVFDSPSTKGDFARPRQAGSWEEVFLSELFERAGVDCLWARDVVARDPGFEDAVFEDYILPDSHPTARYNTLIAREIRRRVLAADPTIQSQR